MDIFGMTLDKVEAEKLSDTLPTSVGVDIRFEDAKFEQRVLIIRFLYEVEYKEKVGRLKISGRVVMRGVDKDLKKVADDWKANKIFSKDVTEPLLNMINVTASLNAVFVARALGLAPPMLPPRIMLRETPKK